jgi:apolipoprotein N-acyltransferase
MRQAAILVLLTLLSAALTTLSLPSFDLGFLGWIALAPFLYALRTRGALAGAGLGWLFGCAFGASSFFWINAIPSLNALRFVMLVMVFSVYYLAFGWAYALAIRRLGSWMLLAAPALWVAFEYLRGSASFLAYPWNFVGHSQYRYLPLIQIADFAGAYGVSFVLAMVSQLLSELPGLIAAGRSRWRMPVMATSAIVVAVLAYGVYRLVEVPQPTGHLRVAIVQANMVSHGNMSVHEQMAQLAAYDRLTREAMKEKPELVVWPSSSLPGPIEFWMIRLYVGRIVKLAGTPLLVGGAGGDKFAPVQDSLLPYSNSEFLLSPSGNVAGQYNKMHLTPFTEMVPLQGLIAWPHWMTGLRKSFVAGERHEVFQVGEARFGAPICWENSFPDVFRRFVLAGANFMASVTNESAFGPTAGPHQTLAMNAFRAVENRVSVARSATTGVSAFIDTRGRIVSRVQGADGADLFVSGVLVRDVPLSGERTFYTAYGDVFAQACALAAALILLLCLAVRPRVIPHTA